MKKLLSAAALAALASAVSQTSAQVLYEPFNHSEGSVLDVFNEDPLKNYTTSGTFWARRGDQTGDYTVIPGLTGPTAAGVVLPGNMGAAAQYWVNPDHPTAPPSGITGRTPNIGFGQTFTSGDVYYSLQLKIPTQPLRNTAGTIAGLANFAIPGDTDIGLFQAGLRYRRNSVDTTRYDIGIQGVTNASAQFAPTSFGPGDTVFIVARYSINPAGTADDTIDFWVNPTTDFGGTTTPITTNATQIINTQDSVDAVPGNPQPMIASFFMRSFSSTSGFQIDELRVDSTWAGVTPDGYLQHGFNTPGGGNWSDWSAANWTNHASAPAYATDAATVGHVANFDNGLGASATVTVDGGGRTVDQINFTNTGSVTIAGDALNVLNFKTNGSAAQVYAYAGNHTLSAPITTEGNLSFKTQAGASITVNDTITATGASKTIGVYGRGTVTLGAGERIDDTARLEVRSGTLDLGGGTETVDVLQLGTSHPNPGVALPAPYNGDYASGTISNGTISANSYNLQSGTISAAVTGTNGVTKTLSGFVELSGNNTYSGITLVEGGRLLLSGTNSNAIQAQLTLPPTSNGSIATLAISSNAALGPAGASVDWTPHTTGGLTGTLELTEDMTLAADRVLDAAADAGSLGRIAVADGKTGTIQSVLSGAGGISAAGPGTLILDAVNTYSGDTMMSGGILLVGNQNQIGDGSATNNLRFNGGTFKPSADLGLITKTVNMIGAGTFDTNGIDHTLSGAFSGTAAFNKAGAGVLTLTADNSGYTGRININGGAVRINHNNALGDLTGITDISGGSDVLNASVLEIEGGLSVAESITVSGKTSTDGGNATPSINNISGDNSITTAVRMGTGGTWYNIQSDSGKLTLAGIINETNATSRTVHLRGGGDGEILAGINMSGAALPAIINLVKHDAGTWTISGASNYLGDTTINGGVLAVGATDHLGSATNTIVFDGGTLRTNGAVTSTRNATVNAGGGTFDSNTFDSSLANVTGSGALAKTGAGMLTANQVKIGGALAVNGGTLAIPTNGGAAGMVEATAVTVGAALLQMNDNDLMVDYTGASPEFAIRDLVATVAQGGTEGIGFAIGDGNTVLAIAESTESGLADLNGVAFPDDTTVIGKYTYYGDANLDGQVTSDDYVSVDVGIGVGDSWVEGDFDFSGTVTSDDYVAIDVNLGSGTGNPLAWAELKTEMVALHTAMFGASYVDKLAYAEANGFGATIVPEPGALSLIGLGAAGLLSRRRRA